MSITANYEGQTNGTAVTAANSITGSPVDSVCGAPVVTGGSAATYSNTFAAYGSLSLKLAGVASTNAYVPYALDLTDDTLNVRFAYYYTGAPTVAELPIFSGIAGGSTSFKIIINTAGTLRIRDFASASTVTNSNAWFNAAATAAYVLPAAGWYWFDFQAQHGTGTTDGYFSVNVYAGAASTTVVAAFTSSAMNMGTNDYDNVYLGRAGNSTSAASTQYYDGFTATTNLTIGSKLGLYGAGIVPTASAGTAQINIDRFATVTLLGTATQGPITGWAWTQTGGTAQAGFPSSLQNPTFTPTKSFSAETLTFSLIATNATGSSTAATTTVALLPCTFGRATGSAAATAGRLLRVT